MTQSNQEFLKTTQIYVSDLATTSQSPLKFLARKVTHLSLRVSNLCEPIILWQVGLRLNKLCLFNQ